MIRSFRFSGAAALLSVLAVVAGVNVANAQATDAAGPTQAVPATPATAPASKPTPEPPAAASASAPLPAVASAPASAEDEAKETAAAPKIPFPALFFWPDETASIAKAIEEHDHPPASELAAKAQALAAEQAAMDILRPRLPNVYVSAILDFGNGDWTVWANGLRVTPNSQSPLFRIVAVRGNSVDIVVPGDDGGRFVLQPYQTWRSRQKDVVEGIVP